MHNVKHSPGVPCAPVVLGFAAPRHVRAGREGRAAVRAVADRDQRCPATTARAWPCISGHATQQAQCSFRSCRVENYSHKANLRPACFALRVCVLGSNWCIKMYVNLKKWLQTDFLPHLRAPNAFFFPERFVPRSFELIFFIPFSLVCSECSGNGRKRESLFLGKSPHFSAAAIAKCLESQNSYFFQNE